MPIVTLEGQRHKFSPIAHHQKFVAIRLDRWNQTLKSPREVGSNPYWASALPWISGPAEKGKVSPLQVGSPVVLTVEPPYLKTAEPMPMMKPNDGILLVGHAGRYEGEARTVI